MATCSRLASRRSPQRCWRIPLAQAFAFPVAAGQQASFRHVCRPVTANSTAVMGTSSMNANNPADAPQSGPERASSRSWPGYVAVAIVGAILLSTGAAAWFLHDIHFPSAAEVTSRRVIVSEIGRRGRSFAQGDLSLPPVEAKDMPADVVNAVLSIEDRRFYRHGGVDRLSELRAFRQNFEAGKIVSGGSTITQQLVKILFLGPQRTYKRKIQEAAISIWIEHQSDQERNSDELPEPCLPWFRRDRLSGGCKALLRQEGRRFEPAGSGHAGRNDQRPGPGRSVSRSRRGAQAGRNRS